MKLTIILLLQIIIVFTITLAQEVRINEGIEIDLASQATLRFSGDFNHLGTTNHYQFGRTTAMSFKFIGDGDQIFNAPNSFDEALIGGNHLTVDKPSGNLILQNNLYLFSGVNVQDGTIDLNGNWIYIDHNGSLSDASDLPFIGSGRIQFNNYFPPDQMNNYNIGGFGAKITTNKNLSSTHINISRTHTAVTENGNTGINRKYSFGLSANNSELDATVKFYYKDSELNGIAESDLCVFSSTNGGSTWEALGGTCDDVNNFVEVSGINSLLQFTLGSSSNPLPVELIAFYAENTAEGNMLKWQTATELNNYGFEVERQILESSTKNQDIEDSLLIIQEWRKLGFVQGHGNSNSPKSYEFLDYEYDYEKDQELIVRYRLRQIDTDGTFYIYNQIAEIGSIITDLEEPETKEDLPTEFALHQNYPNPFNPVTHIQFSIPNSQFVILSVYDILGNEVTTLVDEYKSPGIYISEFDASLLSSGTYIYRIVAGEYIETKKMIIIK
jgi:hypothetical protein